METRKITVITTKTHKTQVIESAATTLGELKTDLSKAGVDYTDCTFFEGLTKIELKNDAAILPHDVPYKGTTTNNLVFMITNASKKIKSGSDRKSIIMEIKDKNLTELVKKTYGRNYTNCKTEDLEKILTMANQNTAKEAPARKEEPKNIPSENINSKDYITKAQLREVIEGLLTEMERADVEGVEDVDIDNIPTIGNVSVETKENSDSPYSSNELDDMFKNM